MGFGALLVEDETTLREVMEQAPAERDLSVQSTGSGKRALQELSLRSFALVITDIRLPGCCGMENLSYCQEHCPDTAVIVVTA